MIASGSNRHGTIHLPELAEALRLIPLLSLLVCAPLQAAGQWYLLARHGECAPVESLKRKVPDLGSFADPQSFAALMRARGHAVTITPQAVPKGSAFEVIVPARELALVFVTADRCGPSAQR